MSLRATGIDAHVTSRHGRATVRTPRAMASPAVENIPPLWTPYPYVAFLLPMPHAYRYVVLTVP
eukprot:6207527-Pleurochrysis_carterae.AAC.1